MPIKFNIIISFSSQDNQPMHEGEKGWVDNFHRFLNTLLGQLLKEKPQIIIKSDQDDHSEESYKDAILIIPILSPVFLKSEVLSNGLRNFIKVWKDKGEAIQSSSSRILKVIKSPVEADKSLPELKDILGYDFYQIDPHSGDLQEFNRFFGKEAEKSYWMKLVDIAYDIYKHLITVDPELGNLTRVDTSEKKAVYLAITGRDLINQHDIIKRELQRHGYKVKPDHTYPIEVNELKKMVKEDLKQCEMSIHMIGEDYGLKPPNTDESYVDIVNKAATEYSVEVVREDPKSDFRRIIWLIPTLDNISERQKLFIENMKSDADSLENAEIFQVNLQNLRSIIRQELIAPKEKKQEDEIEDETGVSTIYLICDKQDVQECKPLADLLEKQGFKVLSTEFEGNLLDLRYLHQQNLRRCDGSIIYCGKAKEEWMKTKLQDILKAPGLGRKKPLKAKAIYIGTEREISEKHLKDEEAMILGKSGKLDPENLKPFLTKLEN